MPSGRKWSLYEDSFLKQNYSLMMAREIGQKLNREVGAVRARAYKISVTKSVKYGWTPEDVDFLVKSYWCMTFRELAKKLNIKEGRVQHKIFRLKLRKELPEDVKKEAVRLLTETNFALRQIQHETKVSVYNLRRLIHSLGITRRNGSGWRKNSLKGFRWQGNHAGKRRHQFLYAYRNTCWDCKKTLLPNALIIHEDWSSLPTTVYVLCGECHKKRHCVNNVTEE